MSAFDRGSFEGDIIEIMKFFGQWLDLLFTKFEGDEIAYQKKLRDYGLDTPSLSSRLDKLPQPLQAPARQMMQDLDDVVGQKSLLRPDLLRSIENNPENRDFFNQVVNEVSEYNQTHETQLDPYVMANQLWQESRFKADWAIHNGGVTGPAQIKISTANDFLRRNPDVCEELGKRICTAADLKDPDFAIPLSIRIMGDLTEKYGSQQAAQFVYNGRPRAIERVSEHYDLEKGEHPTIPQIVEFYAQDRVRVDDNFKNGHTLSDEYTSAWAVESFEYVTASNSSLCGIFKGLDKKNYDKMITLDGKEATLDDVKNKMTELDIPLPETPEEQTPADPAQKIDPAAPGSGQ